MRGDEQRALSKSTIDVATDLQLSVDINNHEIREKDEKEREEKKNFKFFFFFVLENEKNSLQKSMLTEIFHVHHYAKKRNKKANYLMKRRYNHLREIDNYLMKK